MRITPFRVALLLLLCSVFAVAAQSQGPPAPLPAAGQAPAPQTETFDIATFVRPPGWTRSESDGVLVLSGSRIQPGQPQARLCLIYLYPSRASSAPAALEFQTEWQARIGQTLGAFQHTPPEAQTSPDGWTAVSGRADFVSQGVPARAILLTGIGFGRLMSTVVLISPNACQAEINEFFRRMDLHANGIPQGPRTAVAPPNPPAQANQPAQLFQAAPAAPVGSNTGSGDSLSRYVFTPPSGWVSQNAQGGIVLAPAQFTGERCQIQMYPLRNASGPLADLALGTFRSTFNDDPLQTYPSPAKWLARGSSPQGWEYFEIKKLVGGQEGDGRGIGTILLLARLDDAVATIIGISKDFMVSNCFGELQTNIWPAFFYSLSFKGMRPSALAQGALRQQLAGTWLLATGNVGLSYIFQPDGRYATANRAAYITTNKYFGNGSYSFEGNTMVLTGDDNSRTVQMFRLQQVARNGSGNWQDELCMMAAGSGELCYRRER